jgi:pyruvate,water dikinase
LFSADPVTGSYTSMVGNYVYGLGEQLVSGEANAHAFKLIRPKGQYEGPAALKSYASDLYKVAMRLEKELGNPQDIEWAVAGGKLYLLQARPITTLTPGNLDRYEINETLVEDTLWINTNVAEAVPDVFSPLTWSIIRGFDEELSFIPGYYVWSGNICGRVYSNIGRRVSAIAAITGWDSQRILGLLGDIFGQAPDDLVVPVHPFSRTAIIKEIVPGIGRVIGNMLKYSLTLKRFLRETPEWCRAMAARIGQAQTKAALLSLWQSELQPYAVKAWWSHTTGASGVLNIMTLERKLTKLVGKQEANLLLSNLRGEAGLASLGPIVGIAQVIKGDMSRQAYLQQYGHRGPHEFELSIPHPAEDAGWLEDQIAEFEKATIDVDGLLHRQQAAHEAAKQRLGERYPGKVRWLDRQLASVAAGAQRREAARSEFTRVFRVVRTFALRAGELTGIGEDVFVLYLDEVLALLAGRDEVTQYIPGRRETYELYSTLPPFPSIIRGRFNPFQWIQDPHRRNDFYDAYRPMVAPDGDMLTGIAGAAGRVEGRVRILATPEEGDTLQAGEILVARTTNVGWTPLFPKAAAIITDIGAPLSHAAIVARELGIPAVVGCGSATTRLKTGDRVMVDGGQGIVRQM